MVGNFFDSGNYSCDCFDSENHCQLEQIADLHCLVHRTVDCVENCDFFGFDSDTVDIESCFENLYYLHGFLNRKLKNPSTLAVLAIPNPFLKRFIFVFA